MNNCYDWVSRWFLARKLWADPDRREKIFQGLALYFKTLATQKNPILVHSGWNFSFKISFWSSQTLHFEKYISKSKNRPCDRVRQKLEIMQHFQGRLCDKIGLIYDKLCNIFCRANYYCFARFQRRKITLMLLNRQHECKRIIKHLF